MFANVKPSLRPGSALERVFELAPHKPYCSDNKTASLIRVKRQAFNFDYVQVNTVSHVHWLVFDLDHNNPWIWQDVNLPAPNLIVTRHSNDPGEAGKSHLFYAINSVCISSNGRLAPIAYLDAIKRAYQRELRADCDFSAPVCKNPLSSYWHTAELHNHVYELGELADSVTLTVKDRFTPAANDEDFDSRNCSLFDTVRRWAYCQVNEYRALNNYDGFFNAVLDYAEKNNQFTGKGFSKNYNLKYSSVKSVAKSVANWTYKHYTGKKKNVGVMGLADTDISLESKQRLSARYTHQIRRSKTEKKILSAVTRIKAKAEKLTQSAVAKIAGITRQTVSKYKHLLKTVTDSQANNTANVNYGTHQITALVRGGFSDLKETNNNKESVRSILVQSVLPFPDG